MRLQFVLFGMAILAAQIGAQTELYFWHADVSSFAGFSAVSQIAVSTRRQCAYRCHADPACLSVIFDPATTTCSLYSQTTVFDRSSNNADPESQPMAMTGRWSFGSESWTVVLRSTAGHGVSIYDTWVSAASVNDGHPGMLHTDAALPGIYKSAIVDQLWDKVQQVRLSIYQVGVEVLYVVFDAAGSDKMSWMAHNRILATSTTLLSQAPNQFSLSGAAVSRRFNMWYSNGGCSMDSGWMVVVDRTPGPCDEWEVGYPSPGLLYTTTGSPQNAISMGHGDALLISVLA